jgi:putative membrane protein
MKANKFIIVILISFYCLLWIGGIVSYLFLSGPPSDSRWTAPLFLCLAAALALTMTHANYRLPLMACGLIGLAVEVVGVRLGFPFGRYLYTQELRPFILDVPLAIGCAWLVLFAYVKQMLQLAGITEPWQYLCGASWMVFMDLLIDPLASGPLGYWIWKEEGWYCGVPLTNFLGWFGVSLALFLIFRNPWPRRMGVVQVGFSIVMFFSLIALALGIFGALLAGVGLCLLHAWIIWRNRSRSNGL